MWCLSSSVPDMHIMDLLSDLQYYNQCHVFQLLSQILWNSRRRCQQQYCHITILFSRQFDVCTDLPTWHLLSRGILQDMRGTVLNMLYFGHKLYEMQWWIISTKSTMCICMFGFLQTNDHSQLCLLWYDMRGLPFFQHKHHANRWAKYYIHHIHWQHHCQWRPQYCVWAPASHWQKVTRCRLHNCSCWL